MSQETLLVVISDPQIREETQSILETAGYAVIYETGWEAAKQQLQTISPDLILLEKAISPQEENDFVKELHQQSPALPIIFLGKVNDVETIRRAIQAGAANYLSLPVSPQTLKTAVRQALDQRKSILNWQNDAIQRHTGALQHQLKELETLSKIGHSITSQLDLDIVLETVVKAAVDLTNAEEGSLLLLDNVTGELFMRASHNFKEDFARTFRIPAKDSLAGQVLRTGKPLLLNQDTPKKIKTSYLVHNLAYVPLKFKQHTQGVLGIDHRTQTQPFTQTDIALLEALSEYAAIAIENAHLFNRSESQRAKLEAILAHIEDGVMVIDQEGRLILSNASARQSVKIPADAIGQPLEDVIDLPVLLAAVQDEKEPSKYLEINLADGRILSTKITRIPEVGSAIIMQDITQLKELDRIKTDFVNTISHDLRSPLTAILGYIELVTRIGQLTPKQETYLHRVQISVNNITYLINTLMDLGRIEAGFDNQKEAVSLEALVSYSLHRLQNEIKSKKLTVVTNFPADLAPVLGSPIRLRQVLDHLLINAIHYTPEGGKITFQGKTEGNQIILRLEDTGIGILATEQPYVFDKFYRGSNVAANTTGTGLGLAIVKSIIVQHQGRIWVHSEIGRGTTFTMVLPAAEIA